MTYRVSSQPLQRIENEVDILGEQLSVGGGFSYAHHHHHHHQPPSSLPPSTPLQFLSHHDPLSHELFTVVSTSVTMTAFVWISIYYCGKMKPFFPLTELMNLVSFVPSSTALSPLYASPIHKPALPLSAGCAPVALPPQLPALLPVSVSQVYSELQGCICSRFGSSPICHKCNQPNLVYLVFNHVQVNASCAPKCGPHHKSRAGCGRRRGGEL